MPRHQPQSRAPLGRNHHLVAGTLQDRPHAVVQERIASFFMGKGEWKKALQYADEAAHTWRGPGMRLASQCHEALEQWEEAELWMRRLSERYEGARVNWYFWCQRTGRGDLRDAEKLVLQHVDVIRPRKSRESLGGLGIFFILRGDLKEAKQVFKEALDLEQEPYDGLHTVILAEATNDETTRDEALRTTEKHGFDYERDGVGVTQYGQLASMFGRCLTAGTSGKLDLEAVDRLIAGARTDYAANLAYFVGRFLQLRDRQEEALRYLRQAATSTATHKWNHVLARAALRDLAVPLDEPTSKPADE